MANHQERRHGPAHTTQALSLLSGAHVSSHIPLEVEDDIVIDAEEPPENYIQFLRRPTPYTQDPAIDGGYFFSRPLPTERKQSLLTRALLTSPDLMATPTSELPPLLRLPRGMSDASNHSNTSADSIAELTSDGGLTSPPRTATPSPPLPAVNLTTFALLTPKATTQGHALSQLEPVITNAQETTVEAGLGRKRCITFACGRQTISQTKGNRNAHIKIAESETSKQAEQPKRPSVLRFACPSRPSETAPQLAESDHKSSKRRGSSPISPTTHVQPTETPKHRQHRDSESTVKESPQKASSTDLSFNGPLESPVFQQQDLERSSATRFYEFASSVDENDEWMFERTAHRSRLTVNDTLRKENAIRQLGEEAEAEALEEEEAEERAEREHDGNDLDDSDDGSDDDASDGGNETDDEEGFADSDDESDGGSEYQFWTTGLTTAATSADHSDQIRATPHRTDSGSSIESMIHADQKGEIVPSGRRTCRARKHGKMRPATPDLPDSTDFVCGTLDEDRPLEAAYLSCLEQRRRSKRRTIPQDIDPSFPTSDLDDEDDEDDGHDAPAEGSDEHVWIAGQPDNSDDERPRSRTKSTSKTNNRSLSPKSLHSPPPPKRSAAPPIRLRSPPPPKRCVNNRSPPPRRLFGQSPRRRRSPPPHLRNLKSPPSTRRSSLAVSPGQRTPGINVPFLAQRPDLTYTKSLPRSPNPFWQRHREGHKDAFDAPSAGTSPVAELHNRGPIDIVKGLENKRQRRKEKFWRQHCRNAGKDKERRCQPGKGAERMKELGLEMAGRGKGYGQKAQLVLSI